MKFRKLIVLGALVVLCSAHAGAIDTTANTTTEADLQSQNPAQPEPEPATNAEQANQEQQKAKTSTKRSKPIEPFVPSEKVSPDRSVSFPVDI